MSSRSSESPSLLSSLPASQIDDYRPPRREHHPTHVTSEDTSHYPANAVVASTLLEVEDARRAEVAVCTGIRDVDEHLPRGVWGPGRVVGVVGWEEGEEGEGESSDELLQTLLIHHLLTSTPSPLAHIDTNPTSTSYPPPLAYLLTSSPTLSPSSTSPLSPANLHSVLPSSSPSTISPDHLLSRLSILPYDNLPHLVSNLDEITTSLSTCSAQSSVLILITNLSTILSPSSTSTLAILRALLRQLTHLSRHKTPRVSLILTFSSSTYTSSSPPFFAPAILSAFPSLSSPFRRRRGEEARSSSEHDNKLVSKVLSEGVQTWIGVHALLPSDGGERSGRRSRGRVVEVLSSSAQGEVGRWGIF
ncbi:MAG: hypothetical protein Q9227_001077 [Pyrenula ochraceoflavens]